MKINTTRFGEIEIEEGKIIEFPLGIPGFAHLKRYILLDYKDPIKWLHAVDDPDIAFIVAEPFVLFPDYSLTIEDDIEEFLEIKDALDTAILVILNVTEGQLNANLKAPIVVNTSKFKAMQIILDDDRYSFRVPVSSIPSAND
ncbi:flagellar assembly factor FliW [Dissulfurispira thermophila]|uniref:Flagellar assembly factor FliW n=2 Tax=root TaxID=1 RepID=A0A7G1H2N8_9BACT|nr:flagellar assembly protein FliW [Dissulfurispira thermophila]BCB96421.1 flagellar assembly factor FliW [Dissulfurispira thermophila]